MSWRVDSTNLKSITRNKIRLHLIHCLRYNQGSKSTSPRFQDKPSECKSAKAQAENKQFIKTQTVPYTIITWDRKVLETLELPSQQLAECIRKQQRDLSLTTLSSNRTELLVKLVRESLNWRFQWEDKIEVCADKDFIAWVNWDMNVKFINTSIDLGSQPSGSLFGMAGIYPGNA